MITWDESKRAKNLKTHGIDLADVGCVLDAPLVTVEDEREAYGEKRLQSLGWLVLRTSRFPGMDRARRQRPNNFLSVW